MSPKVVILNVFGHRNTGDAMLLEALVDLLQTRIPAGEIEGIAFDVGSERKWMPTIRWHERVGNKLKRNALGKLAQGFALSIGIAIAVSRKFIVLKAFLPLEQRKAIEALDGAELALSCPGGYLEDSNRAYLLNLLQMLIARRLAQYVVLAPQSIGPVRSRLGRLLLAFTLKRMDAIYVREEPSLSFIRNNLRNIRAPVHSSGDLAFWYNRRLDSQAEEQWTKLNVCPDKPLIGITVVEWYYPHHPDPKAAQAAYLGALTALIRHIEAEGVYQIVIFNQVSSDLPVAEKLAEMNPGIIIDREDRDAGVFASMIASCEVFIGSRFHSCIFGLLGAVPTIAIAYLPKTSGIMADLGLSDFVFPIDLISPEALIESYETLRIQRSAISDRIKVSVSHYRDMNGRFNTELFAWARMDGAADQHAPSRTAA